MACATAEVDAGVDRDRRLRLAIASSLGSKVATVILQVLVMPLAIRALGPKRFGIFVMISSSMTWIISAGSGIGDSLVIAMAKAIADDDIDLQSRAISSAFFAVVCICALVIPCFGIVCYYLGTEWLLGAGYVAHRNDILTGLWIMIGFMTFSLMLDVLDSVQTGHQELYIINLSGMLGQLLSAITLLIVLVYHAQSIISLLICMFVMTVIPRLVNAVISVTYVRPHLSPKLIHFDRTIVSTLLSTGVAFSMMSLGHFLRQECGILLVGRMLGPVSVAKYAIVVNITILASGIINMQLRPLLPAVTDAWAKGDYAWIRRTRLRTLSITMGYAIAVALVLAVLGDTIVGLWYGHQLISGSKVPMAVGLSFVLQAWEMNYCLMLFSAGRIWLPVALFTLQSTLALVLCIPMIHRFGSAGAAGAICVSILLINFWILPMLLREVTAQRQGIAPNRVHNSV